jgi:hypothetical protein
VIGELWRPEGNREGFDWRDRVPGGDVVDGVRYVRNLIHHHWADALRVAAGMRSPIRLFSWIWRPSDELPAPTTKWDRRRQPTYDALLADGRVDDTLIALGDVFEAVRRVLDPVTAVPQSRSATE